MTSKIESPWMFEVKEWPLSRVKDGVWEFVQEVTGTYHDAADVGGRLQQDNPGYQYRIWDCR